MSLYGRPEIDCQVRTLGLILNRAQKPVDLYRWLLRHFSAPGDNVLSLHEGTGSAAMASILESRSVIGVDYCLEMIVQARSRLARYLCFYC